ncbi:MAG TPA: T9SS type A sorting domain-containing protein, partial [Rhodothermales bacterium]|nr:T9SS type A sorting domain-containing protein [Rhodothermales bacterium]
DGDAVLAVTSEGFRRSADGGRTWTAAGTVPLPTRYATLRPSTLTGRGGVVYAGYFHVRGIPIEHGGQTIEHYGGVFRSTDGGASWVDVSAGIPATSLGPSPVLGLWAVGPRLFAVTLQGCITRLDGPWAPAACPSSGTTEVVEAGAGLWIAHAGGGLYRSTNAGGSWAPAVAGLPIPTDPDGVAAFWASTRLSGAEGALLAAVVGGVGRLYRYDGAAWAPTGATYPASLTWGRFAAGGGRLYGGARSRGVWTAPLGIVTAAAPEGTAAAVALVVAPNPAVGRAVATLTLAAPQTATVALYDALGRRVAVLNDGPLAAGAHAFALDAERLPAGLYVVRAVGGAGTVSVRMVVAR